MCVLPPKVLFSVEIGIKKLSDFLMEIFIGLNPLITQTYQASKEQNKNLCVLYTLKGIVYIITCQAILASFLHHNYPLFHSHRHRHAEHLPIVSLWPTQQQLYRG